jgi:hypothetical protein
MPDGTAGKAATAVLSCDERGTLSDTVAYGVETGLQPLQFTVVTDES